MTILGCILWTYRWCALISWQHSDGMGGMVDGWVGEQWGGSDKMGGDTNNHEGTV